MAERKMSTTHLLEACKLRFKCGVKLTEKSARRALKVTERKLGNMQLLEARKAIYVKAGRARKVTERKLGNTHLLEVCETIFNYGGKKGGKGVQRRGKVTERKMYNMHLVETGKDSFK
jgi:hypothetical protein